MFPCPHRGPGLQFIADREAVDEYPVIACMQLMERPDFVLVQQRRPPTFDLWPTTADFRHNSGRPSIKGLAAVMVPNPGTSAHPN